MPTNTVQENDLILTNALSHIIDTQATAMSVTAATPEYQLHQQQISCQLLSWCNNHLIETVQAKWQFIMEQQQQIMQLHIKLEAQMKNILELIQQQHNNQSQQGYSLPNPLLPHATTYSHIKIYQYFLNIFTALQQHPVATGITKFDAHMHSTYSCHQPTCLHLTENLTVGLPIQTVAHNRTKNTQQ